MRFRAVINVSTEEGAAIIEGTQNQVVEQLGRFTRAARAVQLTAYDRKDRRVEQSVDGVMLAAVVHVM